MRIYLQHTSFLRVNSPTCFSTQPLSCVQTAVCPIYQANCIAAQTGHTRIFSINRFIHCLCECDTTNWCNLRGSSQNVTASICHNVVTVNTTTSILGVGCHIDHDPLMTHQITVSLTYRTINMLLCARNTTFNIRRESRHQATNSSKVENRTMSVHVYVLDNSTYGGFTVDPLPVLHCVPRMLPVCHLPAYERSSVGAVGTQIQQTGTCTGWQ